MTTQDFYNELLNDDKQPQSARPAVVDSISSNYDKVQELISLLRQSGVDITNGYNEWLKVGFAIAGAFGESGRDFFHNISSLYSEYDVHETDKKYDECLRSENGRTDISTLFYLAKEAGVSLPKREYKSLQVTKGHSDKNVPVSLSNDECEEGMPVLPLFPSSVYENLPDLLNNAVSKLSIPQEKDLVIRTISLG